MAKKQSKRQRDIKTKLMAAICMLLVSSIMMVSSTYAWFTLSTAPEVTGINTAVGANGNLEMALLPKNGDPESVTSAAGDSILGKELKNVTWGNLVDLSPDADESIYGLDKITLFPAELSLTDAGKVNVIGSILKTPQYGADGRISQLADNSTVGYFDKQTQTFSPNTDYGVRAVGTASGMTPRQLAYRNARSAANTAMSLAANTASQSLNNNGSTLANIAIKKGTGSTEFNMDDLNSMKAIVDDLLGTDTKTGSLQHIETAYKQYILAYSASAAVAEVATDGVAAAVQPWNAVEGLVSGTLADMVDELSDPDVGITLPEALTNAIREYHSTLADVTSARTKLNDLIALDQETYTWGEISDVLYLLADPDNMEVNGIKAGEIMKDDNMSDLVNSVAGGGLKVTMKTGGGVYADIADHCGEFTASVTIEEVNYNNLSLKNMTARMETVSDLDPNFYLVAIGVVVQNAGAPASGATGTLPITDMYGYIIDLAFRTNAAESNLLLQQKATDRIYGTDNTNEETMGHGASMTFMATTTDFSNDQVKGLMDAIVLVFFNPADGTIYCYGALDTANATVGADGVTAEIYLYTPGITYEPATEGATHKQEISYVEDTNGTYVADNTAEGGYRLATEADASATKYAQQINYVETTEGATHKAVTSTSVKVKIEDNKIMALNQNQATALSVLVYLDGNEVTNADVAATGSTSMTGTMNLQFASSATLVPMEYSGLHIPGATTAPTTGGNTGAEGGEGGN